MATEEHGRGDVCVADARAHVQTISRRRDVLTGCNLLPGRDADRRNRTVRRSHSVDVQDGDEQPSGNGTRERHHP